MTFIGVSSEAANVEVGHGDERSADVAGPRLAEAFDGRLLLGAVRLPHLDRPAPR
jgi:hypothetical protein